MQLRESFDTSEVLAVGSTNILEETAELESESKDLNGTSSRRAAEESPLVTRSPGRTKKAPLGGKKRSAVEEDERSESEQPYKQSNRSAHLEQGKKTLLTR